MTEEKNYVTESINLKKTTQIRNKSVFFILPLLGQPMYWYYELINCYLGDIKNKPDLNLNKIFVNVRVYDSRLLSTKYFYQFYQLEDNTYMYVFSVPDKYINDYNLFCEGKYSQMTENAKAIICKHSGMKPIMNSIQYKVLYKTADQKKQIEDLIGEKLPLDAEVYSIPDMEKELYSAYSIKNSDRIQVREEESEREKV